MYEEEDYLMLSGLQHFAFCRRQWALIHIEQQWAENERTVDGHLFHATAHNSEKTEKRGDLIITRGLRIKSATLGVSGICDVVEFHKSPDGISLHSFEGFWQPYPVEYKKGKPKSHDADKLQLCGQAMCLEEMLLCNIPSGSLFYGEHRRRTSVEFTEGLRAQVKAMLDEMHDLWKKGYTPRVKAKKGCSACSLKDVCIPGLGKMNSVESYISSRISGE
ncbi:CRISPR-associated protein Cas4 [bacterium D16-51]|nr:CRISPR-associated protein Cas4 [bacterium D16-59]RKI62052.1 CRISPR-associated protein Cas4 [bacterium D16-51]